MTQSQAQGLMPSPPSSPQPGAPYRQIQCAACQKEMATEVCPVCKRPICTACHQARAVLGDKTVQSVSETLHNRDRRAERRAARKALLEQLAYAVGASMGISAMAVALKGIQAIMVGAVLIPMVTLNELNEWRKYRKETKRHHERLPRESETKEDMEQEVGDLAPCSASCWGATGLGQDLIHSSAALFYGIYCKTCLPRQPRSHTEAIAAANLMLGFTGRALLRPPGHPPTRDARTMVRALGRDSSAPPWRHPRQGGWPPRGS